MLNHNQRENWIYVIGFLSLIDHVPVHLPFTHRQTRNVTGSKCGSSVHASLTLERWTGTGGAGVLGVGVLASATDFPGLSPARVSRRHL